MKPTLIINGLSLANQHVGQGTYASRLVEGLLRRGRDISFRVIIPSGLELDAAFPSEHLTTIGGRSPHPHPLIADVYWSNRIAYHVARHFPNAIFHSPSPIWSVKHPTHTVVTLHDCIYRHFTNYLGQRFIRKRLVFAMERFASKGELVLTDSEFSRQELIERAGIPVEKLKVLYPWVDERSFAPVTLRRIEAIRAKLGLPSRFWLYVGGFDYRKNVEFLIASYASAKRNSPNIPPLVLAGRTPPEGRSNVYCDVYGAIARTGLNPNSIILTGSIANTELIALFRLAGLLIYPSKMEGFGLPPAEAMAVGTPVLVSDSSSLPEVVREPHCRFDATDQDSLKDKLLAAAVDESQFRCALPEEFTEKIAITRYLDLLGNPRV